jgi:hypothetical protein
MNSASGIIVNFPLGKNWKIMPSAGWPMGGIIFEFFWNPGIDSKESIPPVRQPYSYSVPSPPGILEHSTGAKNLVGTWLSYRRARLHSLAELIPWQRFLGSLKI